MKNTGILRHTGVYLNGATATGDQFPGTSTNGYSGQPNQYQGQLGAIMELNYAAAQSKSDPAGVATLQGGEYQYVQFAADSTAYAQGQVLYWKDETNYIVTNVAPSSVSANIAGACVTAVTQGYYWFIQITGVAQLKYRSSVTDTTANDGVYVVVNTNTIDALADATADATAGVNKLFIGIAKDAPANSAVKRVYLTNLVRVS